MMLTWPCLPDCTQIEPPVTGFDRSNLMMNLQPCSVVHHPDWEWWSFALATAFVMSLSSGRFLWLAALTVSLSFKRCQSHGVFIHPVVQTLGYDIPFDWCCSFAQLCFNQITALTSYDPQPWWLWWGFMHVLERIQSCGVFIYAAVITVLSLLAFVTVSPCPCWWSFHSQHQQLLPLNLKRVHEQDWMISQNLQLVVHPPTLGPAEIFSIEWPGEILYWNKSLSLGTTAKWVKGGTRHHSYWLKSKFLSTWS